MFGLLRRSSPPLNSWVHLKVAQISTILLRKTSWAPPSGGTDRASYDCQRQRREERNSWPFQPVFRHLHEEYSAGRRGIRSKAKAPRGKSVVNSVMGFICPQQPGASRSSPVREWEASQFSERPHLLSEPTRKRCSHWRKSPVNPILSATWKLAMTHRSICLPDLPALSQVRRYSLRV
jgi:hypothetical protein